MGKLALKLDVICHNLNTENIEEAKIIIEKIAEANRVIAKTSSRKN
uniref:Uncharacterized protein n=1 Tax=Staphylococcus xylosus TaxID=1288 RepID=K8DVF6_STAXY|nr:hypothetical protein [Staphylococcus xylosus]